jgi:Cof subfamily protein (haloacid dehalogenase superfamily)
MAAHSPIRFVLTDFDGTLINSSGALSNASLQAVYEMHQSKIAFSVVSGRPPQGMLAYLSALAIELPIACFNGGMIVDPIHLSVIEEHLLEPLIAEKVIATLHELGLDTWIYRNQKWLIHKRDAPHVQKEIRNVHLEPEVVASYSGLTDQIVKIVGVSDDLALVEKAEKTLQKVCEGRAWAARSQPYYLDITHPDANKGAVVEWYSRRLQIPPSQMLTLGDMPSDVKMFEKTGFSAAMKNASNDVQGRASWISTSNDQDGFAHVIQKFVLKNNPEASSC